MQFPTLLNDWIMKYKSFWLLIFMYCENKGIEFISAQLIKMEYEF